MLIEVLLTLSTALFTGACAFFAWSSQKSALDANEQAWKVRKSAGAIEILRDDHAALEKRIQKLAGRFYRDLRDEPASEPQPAFDPLWDAAKCENWTAAQRDGPGSAAAMCDCDHCVGARAARHDAKSALVPKSNADRIASMRKGLST